MFTMLRRRRSAKFPVPHHLNPQHNLQFALAHAGKTWSACMWCFYGVVRAWPAPKSHWGSARHACIYTHFQSDPLRPTAHCARFQFEFTTGTGTGTGTASPLSVHARAHANANRFAVDGVAVVGFLLASRSGGTLAYNYWRIIVRNLIGSRLM